MRAILMAPPVAAAARTAIEKKDPRVRVAFGVANVLIALLVAICVFRFLPTRWWVVDSGAVVIASLLAVSGGALLAKHALAERITRVAALVVFVLGLAAFAALTITATWISGVYGQVGTSGAIIFGLVSLLVLPYVVVYPAVQLAWIGPRGSRRPEPEPKPEPEETKGTSDTSDTSESSESTESSEPSDTTEDGATKSAESQPRRSKKKKKARG